MEIRRRNMANDTSEVGPRNRSKPYNAAIVSGNLMPSDCLRALFLIVSHYEYVRLRMTMNRVVRLGDVLVRQGVLAIVLLLPCLLAGQQQKPQDQSVPDAPTPQQPDSLGNLTTGCGAGQGNAGARRRRGNKYHPGATCRRQPAIRPRPGAAAAAQHVRTGQRNKDITTFSTRVDYVTVPVTVLDKKHQQVAGLTWRDFQIYENNVRQRIAVFSADPWPSPSPW